jgi:dethiobiotin synthetase
MKPVASGCRCLPARQAPRSAPRRLLVSDDALALQEAAGADDPLEWITPIALRAPLSPHMAARLAGRPLRRSALLATIRRAFRRLRERHEILIVEGVGGLLVPLADRFTFGDLLAALVAASRRRSPVLLVAADRLGVVNHTLLTLEALRRRGLRCHGVVLNRPRKPDYAARTNAAALRLVTDVPVFGPLPFLKRIGPDAMARELERAGLVKTLRRRTAIPPAAERKRQPAGPP